MQTALWPATLGYVAGDAAAARARRARRRAGARAFFTRFVSGRGAVPAPCAIGTPAVRDPADDRVLAPGGSTADEDGAAELDLLDALATRLGAARADWGATGAAGVAACRPVRRAIQTLLDVLGLQADIGRVPPALRREPRRPLQPREPRRARRAHAAGLSRGQRGRGRRCSCFARLGARGGRRARDALRLFFVPASTALARAR